MNVNVEEITENVWEVKIYTIDPDLLPLVERAETAAEDAEVFAGEAETAKEEAVTAKEEAEEARDEAVGAMANKVNKSGDTMTGNLTVPAVILPDNQSTPVAGMFRAKDGRPTYADESAVERDLAFDDDVVHKSGDEVITGEKKFSNLILSTISNQANRVFSKQDTVYTGGRDYVVISQVSDENWINPSTFTELILKLALTYRGSIPLSSSEIGTVMLGGITYPNSMVNVSRCSNFTGIKNMTIRHATDPNNRPCIIISADWGGNVNNNVRVVLESALNYNPNYIKDFEISSVADLTGFTNISSPSDTKSYVQNYSEFVPTTGGNLYNKFLVFRNSANTNPAALVVKIPKLNYSSVNHKNFKFLFSQYTSGNNIAGGELTVDAYVTGGSNEPHPSFNKARGYAFGNVLEETISKVRFGYDADNYYIIIGEITSLWGTDTLYVFIERVLQNNNSKADDLSGITASFVTDLTGLNPTNYILSEMLPNKSWVTANTVLQANPDTFIELLENASPQQIDEIKTLLGL